MKTLANIAVQTYEFSRKKGEQQGQHVSAAQSPHTPFPSLLHLQHTLGNQAVQRLARSGMLQAKLKIGQPDDKYEQEADRVAEQVMRMPAPNIQRTPACSPCGDREEETPVQPKSLSEQITPLVQRQTEEKEEEEEEELQTKLLAGQSTPLIQRQVESMEEEEEKDLLQAKPEGALSSNSFAIHDSSQLLKGGMPLDNSSRAYFETRMGYDLSGVRVHADSVAHGKCSEIHSHAFTVSNHIWLGKGHLPKPSFVMAHELAHVIQQYQPKKIPAKRKPPNLPEKTEKHISSIEPVTLRALFYWVPVGIKKAMRGSLIHKEIIDKMTSSGSDVNGEVPIPNANRDGAVGFDVNKPGQADFYKSKPTRIGISFEKDTGSLIVCGKDHLGKAVTLKGGGPKAQPRQRKGNISGIKDGPREITLGELKPADSGQIDFGKGQLNTYEKGIEFTRGQVNCWAQHVGKTPERWGTITYRRFDQATLPIPETYKFNPAAPLKDRELGVATFMGAKEEVRVVYNPKQELKQSVKGGLYVMHVGKGVLAYFARPENPQAVINSLRPKSLEKAYAGEATQLQNEVIAPLLTAPEAKQSLSIKRIPNPEQDGVFKQYAMNLSRDRVSVLRTKRTAKMPDKLEDPFQKGYSRWKVQHSNFSKKFRGGAKKSEQSALRLFELLYKAEEALDTIGVPKPASNKLPPKEKYSLSIQHPAGKKTSIKKRPLAGMYSWMRAWSNPGIKFLGVMRKTFGSTFIWVSNKIRDLHTRLKGRLDRAKTNSRKGGKSYAAIAIRAFWRATAKIGGMLFRKTINLLVQSLARGLKNKVKELIPMDAESLQKALDDNFSQLRKIQKQIADMKTRAAKVIEDRVAWFDKEFEALKEYAAKAKEYGKYIKWGMVILQCATPPGWGCLKLLAKRLIAEIIEKILAMCEVRKKFQKLVLATGWFNAIPKKLAAEIANQIDGYLPQKIQPIFDKNLLKTAGPPDASDLNCDSEPDAKTLAFLQLQQDLESALGPDGFKSFAAALEKYGIPDGKKLTPEEIQTLRDKFIKSQVDPKMLREFITANPRPAYDKSKAVDVEEFLKHVDKTVREARITAVGKSFKTGKYKKLFKKLKPGSYYIMPFTTDEIIIGRARGKEILRHGTKGEPRYQYGITDLTIDPATLDCSTNEIKMTLVKVELYDTNNKRVTPKFKLRGTSQTIKLSEGDWKKKLCQSSL